MSSGACGRGYMVASEPKQLSIKEPHFVRGTEGESIQNGHSTTESAVKTYVLEELLPIFIREDIDQLAGIPLTF